MPSYLSIWSFAPSSYLSLPSKSVIIQPINEKIADVVQGALRDGESIGAKLGNLFNSTNGVLVAAIMSTIGIYLIASFLYVSLVTHSPILIEYPIWLELRGIPGTCSVPFLSIWYVADAGYLLMLLYFTQPYYHSFLLLHLPTSWMSMHFAICMMFLGVPRAQTERKLYQPYPRVRRRMATPPW